MHVCIYVFGYTVSFYFSHSVQPRALKLLHTIPNVSSDGYTSKNIIYKWVDVNPIDYKDKSARVELPQFQLIKHVLDDCTRTYKESKTEKYL